MALIPARYAATRFPGKLMKQLGNKSIIRHTYENTRDTYLFDEVMVVTDHEIIFDEIVRNGGYAVMSEGHFESGSDRIAAAVRDIEVDVIVNVQGDEPFVNREGLRKLLLSFSDPTVQVASLMCPIQTEDDIRNPSYVKVVVDKNNRALYFSRSPIPFARNTEMQIPYRKHIGIYGYRKEALMQFTTWERSPLESIEMLEQLRYLENGVGILMVETDEAPLSIDTPEDFELAKTFINDRR